MDPVSKNIGLPLNQFFDVAEPEVVGLMRVT